MSKFFYLFCCCLITGLLTGCGSTSHTDTRPSITVSIEPQRFLLESIAGDKWQVNSLLSKGADPENFDPAISDLKKLASSGVYFQSGHLPFEAALSKRLQTNDIQIINTSKGIAEIIGTHQHNHHHARENHCDAAVDPHIWTSLGNARIIAKNMLDALIEIDPQNADEYYTNFRNLDAKLFAADSIISVRLADTKNKTFVVWHPSLSYFARDYGLQQIVLEADNKDLSVESLRQSIDNISSLGASVLFIQPDMDYGRSLTVASQAGVKVESINPTDYNFIDELIRIADMIAGFAKHTDNDDD